MCVGGGGNKHFVARLSDGKIQVVIFTVIMLACICSSDPLRPHFYTVELWLSGVYIIFALKHISDTH